MDCISLVEGDKTLEIRDFISSESQIVSVNYPFKFSSIIICVLLEMITNILNNSRVYAISWLLR